jgi:hypothetical protein
MKDAAILRAAYGPAAVPSMPDPAADDEYTWTEQALPAGLNILPVDERIAALEHQVRDQQVKLADLGELRELNIQLKAMRSAPPIDLSLFAQRVVDVIRQRKTDESSRA